MSRAQEITNPNAITARQYRDRFEALPACPTAGDRLEQMCRSLPSETFWQLYTVPGPLPLTASRETDLFPASPQAACWRWNEILAAWGKLRPGLARSLLVPGRWWREPETRAPALGRSPTPRCFLRARGVFQLQWETTARGPGPLLAEPRSRDRGCFSHTHVPLFGRTTCSVCAAACGTTGGNRTNTQSSRNSQALLGSGWAEAGVKWWGRRQARLTPGKDVGVEGRKALMGKKGLREVEVDSEDDNNLLYLKELSSW